jgi:predicted XRE-type DNA-binding protein
MRPRKSTQTLIGVCEALAAAPDTPTNLTVRCEMMIQIADMVKKSGWTQTEAARRCGFTQPRMSNLMHGSINRFSLDALVNIATALGHKVRIQIDVA